MSVTSVSGCRISTLGAGSQGGADPHALDTLMEGLAFQLDNPDDYGIEDPVTIEVSVTSALRLAGRITGREIDAKWLGAVHSNYSLKSS